MSCPSTEDTNTTMSTKVALGAGCYWGTEKYLKIDFQKTFPKSISRAEVGFMTTTPDVSPKNPTYRQVCSGTTGHVEVLDINLSPSDNLEKTFEEMIKFFFRFHDPTTLNRQGNDRGTQYASVIFVNDEKQRNIVMKVKKELEELMANGKVRSYAAHKVETLIVDYNTFYKAHEEHQEYLMKNPNGYCNHNFRFHSWPTTSS